MIGLNQDGLRRLSSEAEMPLTHRMDQDLGLKVAS